MAGTPGDGALEPPATWTREGDRLWRALETRDFMSAIGLMNEIAMVAEDLGHHPDLHLTGYRRLRIETYSHDVGTLTERDTALAERIEHLLTSKGLASA